MVWYRGKRPGSPRSRASPPNRWLDAYTTEYCIRDNTLIDRFTDSTECDDSAYKNSKAYCRVSYGKIKVMIWLSYLHILGIIHLYKTDAPASVIHSVEELKRNSSSSTAGTN